MTHLDHLKNKLNVLHKQLIMVCFRSYEMSGRPSRPGRNSSKEQLRIQNLKPTRSRRAYVLTPNLALSARGPWHAKPYPR